MNNAQALKDLKARQLMMYKDLAYLEDKLQDNNWCLKISLGDNAVNVKSKLFGFNLSDSARFNVVDELKIINMGSYEECINEIIPVVNKFLDMSLTDDYHYSNKSFMLDLMREYRKIEVNRFKITRSIKDIIEYKLRYDWRCILGDFFESIALGVDRIDINKYAQFDLSRNRIQVIKSGIYKDEIAYFISLLRKWLDEAATYIK